MTRTEAIRLLARLHQDHFIYEQWYQDTHCEDCPRVPTAIDVMIALGVTQAEYESVMHCSAAQLWPQGENDETGSE